MLTVLSVPTCIADVYHLLDGKVKGIEISVYVSSVPHWKVYQCTHFLYIFQYLMIAKTV